MRFLAVALACATLTFSTAADAFVVPRWNSPAERGRSAMLGKWRALTYKKQQTTPVLDPGITITFERSVLWVEHDQKAERVTWRVVEADGNIIGLEITDEKGKLHGVDVLVESSELLTMYVEDDAGDDDEVLRLERVY